MLTLDGISTPRYLDDSIEVQQDIDLTELSQADWDIAQYRLDIIKPLLNRSARKHNVTVAASKAGVSPATIYRWVECYRNTRQLSSLLPTNSDGGAGKSRLSPEVEAIVDSCIHEFHLRTQRPTIAATVQEVRRRCSNAGLPLPAYETIRRRITWIDAREYTKQREGERRARSKHDPLKGKIQDAKWPLALVQMDHTLLPVIIVDDKYRRSIRRAWITLIIDVNSRVCLGMYLSLDAPSAMSAGLCMVHAMLPKEAWLRKFQLDNVTWPFYGPMDILHVDNAREFRGNMLKTAATEYDIDIHLRPVKQPHYGGHIERLMGTVSEELKALKGATFSGPAEKGEYDAEGNACMTFDELEKWLILMFTKYHNRIHAGIGTTPLAKWNEGIFGRNGRGVPPIYQDTEKLRLDFMPYEERTVQREGVLMDVLYWHDVLRPWVGAVNPSNPKHSKKFKFRRDPRDISQLYFYDPLLKRYCSIPYRDTSHPAASIWEFKAAKAQLTRLGKSVHNERLIFDLMNQQRKIEEEAAKKSKVARREVQKRELHQRSRDDSRIELPQANNTARSGPAPAVLPGYSADDVEVYDYE